MIELSGRTVKDAFNPDGDIEIQIIGLRPGEKLFEELLIGNEPETTTHPRIMKAHEEFIAWEDLEPTIDKLEAIINTHNVIELRQLLEKLNLGYVADENIVDWAYLEKTK